MTNKILVDTNILVYAFTDIDLNRQKIAKELLKNLINNNESLAISIQNVVEFTKTTKVKFSKPITDERLDEVLSKFRINFDIISYDINTIKRISPILKESTDFFDCLLVATMQDYDIDTIITENEKDFKKINNITIINPFK
ncbi:MAG TPA: PIN domain-containing protein [archaeon]|jgi:predicted nucleic acid-binding protein|nr:PIN domain-containing protein [archaeon]